MIGMATKKVTTTLDENQLDRIRDLVKAGTTSSVSGFVQQAVAVALDDIAGWGAMLDALTDTGGGLSRQERRWADKVLVSKDAPRARLHSGRHHDGRWRANRDRPERPQNRRAAGPRTETGPVSRSRRVLLFKPSANRNGRHVWPGCFTADHRCHTSRPG